MKIMFIHSAFLLPDDFDMDHPDMPKEALRLLAEYTLNRCDADDINVNDTNVHLTADADEHFYEVEKAMLPHFVQGVVKGKFTFSRISLGVAPGVKE